MDAVALLVISSPPSHRSPRVLSLLFALLATRLARPWQVCSHGVVVRVLFRGKVKAWLAFFINLLYETQPHTQQTGAPLLHHTSAGTTLRRE
uniref:Putative secreted protein n=1 Tax=Anopheles darlingi TaxID=43151 RepID=A0A2M4DER8_ANODA